VRRWLSRPIRARQTFPQVGHVCSDPVVDALPDFTVLHSCYKRSYRSNSLMIVVITALHVMQTWYCDENSVCPSVRPSVTRVDCDKTEEKSVQIFIPYER